VLAADDRLDIRHSNYLVTDIDWPRWNSRQSDQRKPL